ncbi:MAG: tetratricopeptide repeat protein [Pirellulales bacterium]
MKTRLAFAAVALAGGIWSAAGSQAQAFHILERLRGHRMGCGGYDVGCGGHHLGFAGGCGLFSHGRLGCLRGRLSGCHGFGLRNIFALGHGCRFGAGCGGATGCDGCSAGSYVTGVYGPPGYNEGPTAVEGQRIRASASIYREVAFQHDASSMQQGLHAFWAGDLAQAEQAFTAATASDASNPMALYFLALIQHQMGDVEAAEPTLGRAVELERRAPVLDWGRRMERVQGQHRLWLEEARRAELKR